MHSIENLLLQRLNSSPLVKQSQMLMTEEYDQQRDSLLEMKMHPQTTKGAFPTTFQEKINNHAFVPDKIPSYRQKDQGSRQNTGFIGFTSPKASDARAEFFKNNNKSKLLEEKLKTPGLVLTLQNMNTSHQQGKLNSPIHPNSAKGSTQDPSIRKINAMDNKLITITQNSEKNQGYNQSQLQSHNADKKQLGSTQYSINNFLVDLGGMTSDSSMKISKININNFNNINTINTSEKCITPKDNNNSSQYKELLKLLQEKNIEINKLSHDKSDLKLELQNVTNEVKGVRKMKQVLRDKEKIADGMHNSLTEALRESHDLKREIQYQKQGTRDYTNATLEVEGAKNFIDQLKSMSINENEDVNEKKSYIMESATKSEAKMGKKPESSYLLSNLEYRTERNSNPVNSISHSQFFQRNLSTTIEDNLTKKLVESPYYYEKNPNGINKSKVTNLKSPSNITKNISISSKIIKPPLITSSSAFKKGEFNNNNEVSRNVPGNGNGLVINTKTLDKLDRIMPHTTTHVEFDPSKRKLSHDSKINTEGFMTSLFNKKNSITSNPENAFNQKEKEEEQSSLSPDQSDIGKALNILKERIKKLLQNHRHNHDKLKKINDIFIQKLENLTTSQLKLVP